MYYPFLDAVTNRKEKRLDSGLKCRGREIVVIPEVLVIVYESAEEVNHRFIGDLASYGSQPWSRHTGMLVSPPLNMVMVKGGKDRHTQKHSRRKRLSSPTTPSTKPSSSTPLSQAQSTPSFHQAQSSQSPASPVVSPHTPRIPPRATVASFSYHVPTVSLQSHRLLGG